MKKPLRRGGYTNQLAWVVWHQQQRQVPVSSVVQPTVSQASFTPQDNGSGDAGGGSDNTGTVEPSTVNNQEVSYLGSDGVDLLVLDMGGGQIGVDTVEVNIESIGVVSCIWNAATSRYEAVLTGIALALTLLIGVSVVVVFTF